jgi:hypothetical protein
MIRKNAMVASSGDFDLAVCESRHDWNRRCWKCAASTCDVALPSRRSSLVGFRPPRSIRGIATKLGTNVRVGTVAQAVLASKVVDFRVPMRRFFGLRPPLTIMRTKSLGCDQCSGAGRAGLSVGRMGAVTGKHWSRLGVAQSRPVEKALAVSQPRQNTDEEPWMRM